MTFAVGPGEFHPANVIHLESGKCLDILSCDDIVNFSGHIALC